MRVEMIVLILCAAVLAITFSTTASRGQSPASGLPQVVSVTGDVEGTHDPSIAKDGSSWYLFATATEPKRDGEVELWMTRFHDRGARKRRMPPHVVVLCVLYWVLGSENLGDGKGGLIGL